MASSSNTNANLFKTLFGSCTGENYKSYACHNDCTAPEAAPPPRKKHYQRTSQEIRRQQSRKPHSLVGSYVSVHQEQQEEHNSNINFLSRPEEVLDDSGITFQSHSNHNSNQEEEEEEDMHVVTPEHDHRGGGGEGVNDGFAFSEGQRMVARQMFVSRYRRFQYQENSGIEPCNTMNTMNTFGTIYSSEFDSAWKHEGDYDPYRQQNYHPESLNNTIAMGGAGGFPQSPLPRVVSHGSQRSRSKSSLASTRCKNDDLLLIVEDDDEASYPDDERQFGEI